MKLLFTFLLSLFAWAILGQEIVVSETVQVRADANFEVIGKLKEKTLLFVNKITEFEVIGFNEKMNKVFEKEITLEKRLPKIKHILAPSEEEFVLFYTHREKNHLYLKAHRYDHVANPIDTVIVKDYGNRLSSLNLQVYHSEDKTKVVFYEFDYGKIKDIFVFDTNTMEILWKDDFSEISLNNTQGLDQIVLDNQGDLYLIVAKDNFPSKSKEHYFEVYERQVGNSALAIHKINLEGVLTYDNIFEYDNLNQSLVAGGLYSEKSRGKAQGYYFLSLPKASLGKKTFQQFPFDIAFSEEFLDKTNLKNSNLDDTKINEILFRRDGGILLIGERQKLNRRGGATTSTYYNPNFNGAQDYFFNNMFVFSIHPTGDLHWQKVLHKKQYSYDDDGSFSSYFLMKTPQNIHLIFNDDIKIENTVSAYQIKGNGAVERTSILNTEDQDLQLQFKEAIQISSREMIVASERRNRLRLVKLKF